MPNQTDTLPLTTTPARRSRGRRGLSSGPVPAAATMGCPLPTRRRRLRRGVDPAVGEAVAAKAGSRPVPDRDPRWCPRLRERRRTRCPARRRRHARRGRHPVLSCRRSPGGLYAVVAADARSCSPPAGWRLATARHRRGLHRCAPRPACRPIGRSGCSGSILVASRSPRLRCSRGGSRRGHRHRTFATGRSLDGQQGDRRARDQVGSTGHGKEFPGRRRRVRPRRVSRPTRGRRRRDSPPRRRRARPPTRRRVTRRRRTRRPAIPQTTDSPTTDPTPGWRLRHEH